VSPLHHAIDALTAAILDLQHLGRRLEQGGEIRREHLDSIAKVDDRLHELKVILQAFRTEDANRKQ
jgi:hypothetical protein